jgi:hypothetical protein
MYAYINNQIAWLYLCSLSYSFYGSYCVTGGGGSAPRRANKTVEENGMAPQGRGAALNCAFFAAERLQAGLSGIIGEAFRDVIRDRTHAALESRAKAQ